MADDDGRFEVYSRIIVPYDGSQRSLMARPVATGVAAAFGCGFELVHVPVADDPPSLDDDSSRIVSAEDPSTGLIEETRATAPPGLLCMTTRGRGVIGELVFGSVANQIVRDLHAPVLLVGPRLEAPAGRLKQMVVCLDGSSTADSILPVVGEWALELQMQVHLVHVSYPLVDPRIGRLDLPEETRETVEVLRRSVADLRAVGVDASWDLVEDTSVAVGVAREAAHGRADVIALATHGRTGAARLLAGSVALGVIRKAPVPVLAVRPEHLR